MTEPAAVLFVDPTSVSRAEVLRPMCLLIRHPDGEVVFTLDWDGTVTTGPKERVAEALEHALGNQRIAMPWQPQPRPPTGEPS